MKFLLFIPGLLTVALMCSSASAQLSSFYSDFEDLVPAPAFLPIGDGWLFFHTNVAGLPETNYGGDAPNGPQISMLADADGDPGVHDGTGNQYLNIYSDYNNSQSNPALTNSVFQEQTFTAAEADNEATWTFSFDYEKGCCGFGPGDVGSATTAAFITAFDGAFNELATVTFDTTAAPATFTNAEISLTLDEGWDDGGILQFGFRSIRDGGANPDETTGVYYDNVCFYVLGDANDDGVLNNLDITFFGQALFSPAAYAAAFPDVDTSCVLDMNGDGFLNNFDISGFGAALGF